MKTYRIILAEEDPHEYDDSEKVVADGLEKPSFADVRHMLEIISSSAVMDDIVYNGVFQLFQCIREAVRRANLSKEEFPVALRYRHVQCIVSKPEAGAVYSTAWTAITHLDEIISAALNRFK